MKIQLAALSLFATACGAAEPVVPAEPKDAPAEDRATVKRQPDAINPPSEGPERISWSLKASSPDKLPACTPETEGRLAWVVSEKTAFACSDGAWAALDLKGRDGKDGASIVGPAGRDGSDGQSITGAAGRDGVDGQSIVGPRGERGEVGSQGIAGMNGTSAPTVVSVATSRFLFPTSALNAVTASAYGGFTTNSVVSLQTVTRSDGSRCVSGSAYLRQTSAPYNGYEAEVAEKCGTGELRLGFTWSADHGITFALSGDGLTVKARAGWWGTGASYAAPSWGAEQNLTVSGWDVPTSGL